MVSSNAGSSRQKQHYEAIHDAYEAHYFDATALAYRNDFILAKLLAGLNLNDRDVADLASGSGYNSQLLIEQFPRARLTGFDISQRACDAYQRAVGAPAVLVDLTSSLDFGPQFDVLLIVGGLHHCVSNLDQAFANAAMLLRPGGYLLMVEPNQRFLLEAVRQYWYRADRYFDHLTEHPLDYDELVDRYAGLFQPIDVRYFGGPAYYFILNSLVTRIPVCFKAALAKILWPLERGWNRLPGKILFPAFAARWQRLP
jgi:SAM-dependent methyltransferase